MSGYQEALQAAGAEVLAFQEFGSYQGDWIAKVTYGGQTGYVTGSYGSCSGCDAFQGEFDFSRNRECEDHRYMSKCDACEVCDAASADYDRRLREFGEGYLGDVLTQEQAEAFASRNWDWDTDAQEMVEWVKAQATV